MNSYRFKPGINLVFIDSRSVGVNVGSDQLLVLRNLDYCVIKFISSFNYYSIHNFDEAKRKFGVAEETVNQIIRIFQSFRLIEEYKKIPQKPKADAIRTPDRPFLATMDLQRPMELALHRRKRAAIGFAGLDRFSSAVIMQLAEAGFRKFVLPARGVISENDLMPVYNAKDLGKMRISALQSKIRQIAPSAKVFKISEKRPDLLIYSANYKLPSGDQQIMHKNGIPNMFVLFEPKQVTISPVLQRGTTPCYNCYEESLGWEKRMRISPAEEIFAPDSYNSEDLGYVNLAASIVGMRIREFVDSKSISWDGRLAKILHYGCVEYTGCFEPYQHCFSCKKRAPIAHSVIPIPKTYTFDRYQTNTEIDFRHFRKSGVRMKEQIK